VALIDELQVYENQAKAILTKKYSTFANLERALDHLEEEVANDSVGWHRYGGNRGVNLGRSAVSGGSYADASSGISGSIHCSRFAKQNPELAAKIQDCINCLLDAGLVRSSGTNKQKLTVPA
jgi:hypothetical protein